MYPKKIGVFAVLAFVISLSVGFVVSVPEYPAQVLYGVILALICSGLLSILGKIASLKGIRTDPLHKIAIIMIFTVILTFHAMINTFAAG